ncbi:transposase [Actinomadura gamaensis]|uniref:Transposase n=1 Tax=Actinomadura gamaensis TaxID=1763541 RepID=A0ABV9U6D4_9ACTN
MQRLQWFLSQSPWEHEPITDRRIALLTEHPATAPHGGGALLLDDSGDRKAGHATAFTSRQYIGSRATVTGGIVAVNTAWADQWFHYRLHTEPYRPAPTLTGSRTDPGLRTKGQLAAALAERARQAGIPIRALVADCWTTSARAERTRSGAGRSSSTADHLRSRGENRVQEAQRDISRGPPPLARRERPPGHPPPQGRRTTSARAEVLRAVPEAYMVRQCSLRERRCSDQRQGAASARSTVQQRPRSSASGHHGDRPGFRRHCHHRLDPPTRPGPPRSHHRTTPGRPQQPSSPHGSTPAAPTVFSPSWPQTSSTAPRIFPCPPPTRHPHPERKQRRREWAGTARSASPPP